MSMKKLSYNEDVYWANDEPDNLAKSVSSAWDNYQNENDETGLWRIWQQMFRAYFGMSDDGGEHETSLVSFLGPADETVYIRVNHLRNLIRHVVTIATANRPGFNPRPINDDYASKRQVQLTRNVLEYYVREQRLDLKSSNGLEAALIFGCSYMWSRWDRAAGKNKGDVDVAHEEDGVDEETGLPYFVGDPSGVKVPQFEGDLKVDFLTPLEVRCARTNGADKPDWVIVKQMVNRWNLVKLYPDFADDIKSAQASSEEGKFSFIHEGYYEQTEQIPVLHFYHARTPAIPNGRYAVVLAGGQWVEDGELPYKDIPIYRIAPGEIIGTDTGYADGWDLLAVGNAHDAALSTILTNHDAFGVPNIAQVEGTDLSMSALVGGMNVFNYPAGQKPPELINLQPVSERSFDLVEMLRNMMEVLSGINSTTRGDPASNIKSGSMAALMQNMTLQYNAGLQASYFRMLEDVGTSIVRILQSYAKEDRIVSIAGNDMQDAIVVYSSEKLSSIDRVVVDIGTNILRSNEGRMALAEMGYQQGDLSFSDVLELIKTGNVPDKNRRETLQRSCAIKENELLMAGPPTKMVPGKPIGVDPMTGASIPGPPMSTVPDVMALVIDDHIIHIHEHSNVLAMPMGRGDSKVVEAVMSHIDHHKRLLVEMDPALAMILGLMPPQQGAPEQGGKGGGEADMPKSGEPSPTPGPIEGASSQGNQREPKQPKAAKAAKAPR